MTCDDPAINYFRSLSLTVSYRALLRTVGSPYRSAALGHELSTSEAL